MSTKSYTDEELVQKFWHSTTSRERSIWGYRTWMREAAPRLYRIMLDGLQARRALAKESQAPSTDL